MSRPTGARRAVTGAAAAVLALLSVGGPAYAADGGPGAQGQLSIDHSETQGNRLQLLVSVPAGEHPDPASVRVSIGGSRVQASAKNASTDNAVHRTTVLAIDTSDSMHGRRISEARKAARTYLASVPDNVAVGLVTFDSDVRVALEPDFDRGSARAAVAGLSLARQTSLYDGVRQAIKSTGTEGQREVLVLSDGKDTSKVPLRSVLRDIRHSGVRLDVVALEQDAGPGTPLARMAAAGKGRVLRAGNPQALSAAFADEADVLSRQLLVTATIPRRLAGHDASVEVSLTAGAQTYDGSAFLSIGAAPPSHAGHALPPVENSGWSVPRSVVLGAIPAIGLGVLGIVFALLRPARRKPPSIAEHIERYGPRATRRVVQPGQADRVGPDPASIAEHAKQAAAKMLESNRSLEARIADRLEGAAMSLKPAEWILLHGGVAIAAGLLGVLLGGGNPVMIVIFLAVGAIGPWVYLGMKRSQRIRAFDNGLADTLQLVAGSLSAGLSLAQSIDTVVREGAEPISSEFRRVIVESRLGVSLEDAMDGVAQRMHSKDFAWVVMAIRIQREVGGNLAELLLTVAGTLRERAYLRRHVRALSAEGRLSCWILGGLPPVFMVYLVLTKPDYVHPMFTTALGLLMCVGAVVMLAIGVFWMSKVAKVEI